MVSKSFKLGFCPTMAEIAMNLKNKNDFIELYPFGSAAEALFYLRSGYVDSIVIGRFAKSSELAATIQQRCIEKEGYTLISRHKGFIEISGLPKITVHTYLPKDLVKSKYPELKNVIYHNTLEEAFSETNFSEATLINWHHYCDDFELLIPIENGEKVKKYRLPILFYQKQAEVLPNLIGLGKTQQ